MSSILNYPILVISYNDDVRTALVSSLAEQGVISIPCENFLMAEDKALEGICNGILVDLQSVIKAKGDEKIIACSLTGFFPTLRVRALGSMLVPMAMPGDARQDSNLKDFLLKTCQVFVPRRLRVHRRRDLTVSTLMHLHDQEIRCFTLNMSWGGVFIVHPYHEQFSVGDSITIVLPEFDLRTPVTVRWIHPWGERRPPGIGVEFEKQDELLENTLALLLKHDKLNSRDRMVAR